MYNDLNDIGKRINDYAKAIKRLNDLFEVMDYLPIAKKKIALSINKFRGKLAFYKVEFDAEYHGQTLKSVDIMDRKKDSAKSFDSLLSNEEGLYETPIFHKAKYMRKTFENNCLEMKAKLEKIGIENIPNIYNACLMVIGKTPSQANKAIYEALQFEFYGLKQDNINLIKVIDKRQARLNRTKADRHLYGDGE